MADDADAAANEIYNGLYDTKNGVQLYYSADPDSYNTYTISNLFTTFWPSFYTLTSRSFDYDNDGDYERVYGYYVENSEPLTSGTVFVPLYGLDTERETEYIEYQLEGNKTQSVHPVSQWVKYGFVDEDAVKAYIAAYAENFEENN